MRAACLTIWLATCVLFASRGMAADAEEEKTLPRQHEKVSLGMTTEKLLAAMPGLKMASASPCWDAIQYQVYRYDDKEANWEWSVGCYKGKVIWFTLMQDLPPHSKEQAKDLFKQHFAGMWESWKWTFDERGDGYGRDKKTIVSFFVVQMRHDVKKFRLMVTDREGGAEMTKAERAYQRAHQSHASS